MAQAFIDAQTGTVLGTDSLYLVEATEHELDIASESDSQAHDLAMDRTCSTKVEPSAVGMENWSPSQVAAFFGWQVERDNTGQVVIYCGTGGKDGR